LEFEEHGEDSTTESKKPGWLFKTLAVIVVIAFAGFSMPHLSYLFTDPPGSLDQNRILMNDELVIKSKPAVVYIEAVDTTKPLKVATHQGTGFNLDESGKILTNRHVVQSSSLIIVSFAHGARFFAANYEEIPGYDLAVISLESQGLPYLRLESVLPAATGDTVTVIGNPLGLSQISQRGKVGAFRRTKPNASPVFELEFPISQGSSGSPVINTQGKVVGIVFASIAESDEETTDRHGLAIPVNVLLEQLANPPQS